MPRAGEAVKAAVATVAGGEAVKASGLAARRRAVILGGGLWHPQ